MSVLIPWGASFLLNATPAAVTLADGKFVVAWRFQTTDATQSYIEAQVFNADGTPLGNSFRASPLAGDYQYGHSIVALKDGGFAISYASQGTTNATHVAAFTSSGALIEDVTIVPAVDDSVVNETSMTVLADGRLIVSWTDMPEGMNYDVWARILDPWTTAVSVAGTNGDDHYIGTGFNDLLGGSLGNDRLIGEGATTSSTAVLART